jgi:Glycosyl transferase family 2/Methionine biosynthesis protein MetW
LTQHIHSASSYDYWIKKNWYYHQYLTRFYQWHIPRGKRVLQIGCKTGYLLASVKPSIGIGIESEEECLKIAQEKYPSLKFYHSLHEIPDGQNFDYIILSCTTHEVNDIQDLFTSLIPYCHDRTRIIIDSYSFLWEPILRIAQKLKLRRATPLKNWVSLYDLQHFLRLAHFDVITSGRSMLIPYYIPIISWLFNTYLGTMPFINRLCLIEWIVARPAATKKNPQELSISIIIPCRNERGNIESAVLRCPQMGKKTEIIFIEGNSHDGTLYEIQRVAKKYPEKIITYYVQDGKGKGDAVRKGFSHASGDILMIQDADLTAPPEELSKFFDALLNGHGEFINGSRLIYGMETEAMRFLNIIANHCFALGFSWLLGQRTKDTLCGTKVLFKKDYDLIANNRSYFGDFDPFGDFDLLFGAAKLNLKIIDLPVHYKARIYGSTQIRRFYHGLILLKMSLIACKKFKFR